MASSASSIWVGKDVDAAQDDHVVGPPGDLLHPAHGAGGAGQQAGKVAGAVADDREGLLGQRGENQLAPRAFGQRRAGIGIDDLGVEVILPDVQPVLGLHAFHRHARTDHLREAVDVDRMHVESRLDLLPHGIGPGFRAEDADLERRAARVDALGREFDRGWRAHRTA